MTVYPIWRVDNYTMRRFQAPCQNRESIIGQTFTAIRTLNNVLGQFNLNFKPIVSQQDTQTKKI